MAASVPVSRHLVYDVSSGARRASLFLNPSGKALTLLAEDAVPRNTAGFAGDAILPSHRERPRTGVVGWIIPIGTG